MRAKLKIIRYRKRWPLKSSYEISKIVGVSRQYVSKILSQAELPTSAPRERKIIFFCKQCDVGLPYSGKRGQSKNYCSDTCKYSYRWIKVKCSFCRVVFRRKRSQLTWAAKAGYNRIYCGKRCQYKGWRLDDLKHGDNN